MPSSAQATWYMERFDSAQRSNLRVMLTALLQNEEVPETEAWNIKVAIDHFDTECFDSPLLAKYLTNTMFDIASNNYAYDINERGEAVLRLPKTPRTTK